MSKVVKVTPKLYGGLQSNNSTIQDAPKGYVSPISGETFEAGKLTNEKYLIHTWGGEVLININMNENINFISGNVFENYKMLDYSLTRNCTLITEEYEEELGNYDNIKYEQQNKERKVFAYYFESIPS